MSRDSKTDVRIAEARERLHRSRAELFDLARELKGDRSQALEPGHFPRSRIMRALTGKPGRVALATAALALVASRRGMLTRVAGLTPILRPLLMRYVMRRLVG